MRPTSVLPVKDRWRDVAAAQHGADGDGFSASAGSTFSTPAGMPARCASSAIGQRRQRRLLGQLDDTGQPAASAGATLRVIIAMGKFHGVIAAQTPIGCGSRGALVGVGGGMVSP